MKKISIILFLVGLAVATGAMVWLGADEILRAVLSVGVGGLALLVLWQAAVYLVVGLAWHAACPGIGLLRLSFARVVREAASTCLPFSQVGGILLGVYATCFQANRYGRAVLWPEAASANIADITIEILGQVLFIILSLGCLLLYEGHSSLGGPVLGGVAVLVAITLGLVWFQKRGGGAVRQVVRFLGRHIAGQWSETALGKIGRVEEEMEKIWSSPRRIIIATLWHFAGWLVGVGGTWLAYDLLGAPITLTGAIVIEGITCAIMSVFFFIPAGLGVQETAYMTLGHVFGIDPHLSFALSLLRRARDLVIGVPVLLVWQMIYIRTLKDRAADLSPPAPPSPGKEQNPHD